MANISFVKNPNPETPGTIAEAAPAVVTTPEAAPAASIPSTSLAVVPSAPLAPVAPAFFDDGNINFKDIIVPRLNVVQKVGDLSELFTPGEIVLNQSTVIHVPDTKEKKGTGPLVLIPIGCRPLQFAEKVSGGGRGLFVNSEAEVVAANGTLNYSEWNNSKTSANPKKRFEEYATFLFLVKQPKELLPDEEHQLFTHEIDGEYYTLALMGLKGTWFTGFAKRLFTERRIGFLKAGGYASFNWNLATTAKAFSNGQGGQNYAIVPVVTNGTRSTPAVLAYVKEGIGFGA